MRPPRGVTVCSCIAPELPCIEGSVVEGPVVEGPVVEGPVVEVCGEGLA